MPLGPPPSWLTRVAKHTMQNSTKLEFFNTFKNDYAPSSYLGLTNKPSGRKELVKLRIGNHNLRIETGRYDQIPRVNKLCPICASNQIEDESHFLIYCNKYSILRNKFYGISSYHHIWNIIIDGISSYHQF